MARGRPGYGRFRRQTQDGGQQAATGAQIGPASEQPHRSEGIGLMNAVHAEGLDIRPIRAYSESRLPESTAASAFSLISSSSGGWWISSPGHHRKGCRFGQSRASPLMRQILSGGSIVPVPWKCGRQQNCSLPWSKMTHDGKDRMGTCSPMPEMRIHRQSSGSRPADYGNRGYHLSKVRHVRAH